LESPLVNFDMVGACSSSAMQYIPLIELSGGILQKVKL